MGFPKKLQVDTSLDSDGKKWVIAGISIRASLKPINTKPKPRQNEEEEDNSNNSNNNIEDEEECSTTPTAKESRIPDRLPCPPAPRKRRPSLKCRAGGVAREFFNPPDLESVFQRRVERT